MSFVVLNPIPNSKSQQYLTILNYVLCTIYDYYQILEDKEKMWWDLGQEKRWRIKWLHRIKIRDEEKLNIQNRLRTLYTYLYYMYLCSYLPEYKPGFRISSAAQF
jgi:hypothetical protein